MHLMTADGTELLPDPGESLTLNLGGTGPMPRTSAVTVVKLFNDATTAYRTHQLDDETEEIDPYNSLGFQEFRPSGEAHNHLQNADGGWKSENSRPDYLELNDSSGDDPDRYFNELGDEIREVRETLVFTPNVYWRSAHNLVSQTD